MFDAVAGPYLVPFDGSFRQDTVPTRIEDRPKKKQSKAELREEVARLQELQSMFQAHDRHALLVVFQPMDAAGKDSTIRAVMSGINPAGSEDRAERLRIPCPVSPMGTGCDYWLIVGMPAD